jgi:hypothetical protein
MKTNKLKIYRFGSIFLLTLSIAFIFVQCKTDRTTEMPPGDYDYKVCFLHHSTGAHIWYGNSTGRNYFSEEVTVPRWFMEYNEKNNSKYLIEDKLFPKAEPYGWNNYPYDYYNIWVKNAGEQPFMKEPTLEMLTKEYDMIVFKHCFPVSNFDEDTGNPDINSSEKRIENYKLQYEALKTKMQEFPETKFVVWTGAALTKYNTVEEAAKRAKVFFDWVRNDWDTPDDNIFIWDFRALETEGELYLKTNYAKKKKDSHPGKKFAASTVPLFSQRIIDIIETNGQNTTLTGEIK